MLKTIGQYVGEFPNEDIKHTLGHVGISDEQYRKLRHKPVVLASTEEELHLIKFFNSMEFFRKTGSYMNTSFFTYKNEIYPQIKLSLVNATRFSFLDVAEFEFLVKEVFSTKFLTEMLEEMALEKDKTYEVDENYKRLGSNLFPAFCADIERCLFDVLDLEEGFAVLNYIQDNFHPIFYANALMHYVAQKYCVSDESNA